MSAIKDTFFGGAAKKAGEQTQRGLERGQELIAQQSSIAREEGINLFGGAQTALGQGFQGALDVFGQSIPAQAALFQGGNVAAQQQLTQGLPQIQAALLGQPVDFGALQPQTIGGNLGLIPGQPAPAPTVTTDEAGGEVTTTQPGPFAFAQQTLPEQTPIAEVITPPGTLSAGASNVHPLANKIIDAFNRGKLTRAQALNRLKVGNAPGKGKRFPGLPDALALELLDFAEAQ